MLSKQLAGLEKHVVQDASFMAFRHMMRGRIYIYIYIYIYTHYIIYILNLNEFDIFTVHAAFSV